jgi:hypothetical protein
MNIRTNLIVSKKELEVTLQEHSTSLIGKNAYDSFIEKLKNEEKNNYDDNGKPLVGYEKHHIIPRFDGGTNDKSNIVVVSVKDHVIAHWLRWEVLKKPQDYTAFLFRIGDNKEAKAQQDLAVKAARERDKKAGLRMYNSKWQREMGKRGGSRGGFANTEKQFIARQKVGLENGQKTGIKNQSSNLSEFLSKYSIWAHSQIAQTTSRVKDRGKEFYCIIEPKPSFIAVVNSLNLFVPDAIKSSASFAKVVNKERKQMYGWRIVKTLTFEEVEDNIQKFGNFHGE